MVLNPYQKYQTQNVMTASPEELLLMLYNGCVRFIKQGIMAVEEKDVMKAHENIVKAQDIILEFMSTLDSSAEIAKTLMPLYEYLYRRLVQANIEKNTEILNEVLRFVSELRDTWTEASKITKMQKAVDRF